MNEGMLDERVALAAARAAIAKVKAVVDAGSTGPLSHYLIRGGGIAATTALGGLLARAPFPWNGEALAASGTLEAVMERMPSDPIIAVERDVLLFRAGRARGEVKTLPISSAWLADAPSDEGAIPVRDEDWRAVEALEPFVAEKNSSPWMTGLIFQDSKLIAVGQSGTVIATALGPDVGSAIIPKRAVALAVAMGKPARWRIDERYAALWWDDGTWVRAQTIAGKVPGNVANLVAQAEAGLEAPPITDEWRAAVERVAGFAEKTVRLEAERAVATNGVGTVEDFALSPVPASGATVWIANLFLAVLKCADRWDLTGHPAPFSGPLVRGLIVGQRTHDATAEGGGG